MTDLGKQARWVEPAGRRTSKRSKTSAKRPDASKSPNPDEKPSRSRRSGNYLKHRQRLYHAYNSTCWLCGKPNAAQIDHLIPLWQGGSDNFENLRLAHDECNSARNRRNHQWHKAPLITADGFPAEWNGMPLVPEMWDVVFAAKALRKARAAKGSSTKGRRDETVLGKRAKWIDPDPVDLDKQAKWVDP